MLFCKARSPIAVLKDPDVFNCKAALPIAVLWDPVVLNSKALFPIAVLKDPDVLLNKDANPIAVLWDPVVLFCKAQHPAAKLCVPTLIELKFVVEPIEMFEETFPPPLLKNTPLIEPVAVKEPEISTVFAAKSPFINGVPEPEAIYNLLLSSVEVEGPAPNPIAILFEEFPIKNFPAFCPNAILFDPDVPVTLPYKA